MNELTRKVRKAVFLLKSEDQRDRIFLERRLRGLPGIGRIIGTFQSLKGRLFQHTVQDYVRMQKAAYEKYSSADRVSAGNIDGDYVVGSWRQHDEWPDYEDYLMKYVPKSATWIGLDFGCGPGRNIRRWQNRFQRIDGVDISSGNLENARKFLSDLAPSKQPRLFLGGGMGCGDAPTSHYDFAFSTICLQHICVYDVRFSIFQSLFKCLKPGGRLSIQMGFGSPSPGTVRYHDNFVRAAGTNRECDVCIRSPDEVRQDLEKIGFVQFEYWLCPVGPGDVHPQWIFFTAIRPAEE